MCGKLVIKSIKEKVKKLNKNYFYSSLLNKITEPNIAIIPINFIKENSSFQITNPIIVATKGSTVTKIAALPVSIPLNPIV